MKGQLFIYGTVFLLCFQIADAQDKIKQFHTSVTYHGGFLVAHRPNVEVLVNDYSRSFEVSFEKKFGGRQEWQQKYAYPYAGVSFIHLDFGNPEQMGRGMALFGFYNFPIVEKNRFELLFKLGFGPGWVEKVFDKKDNYKNQTVSLHFNGFAFGNLMTRYTISDAVTLNAGLSLSHFSNAAAKKPNLGINVVSLNAGLGYRFSEIDKVKRDKSYKYTYSKKWKHDFIGSFGRKTNEIEGPEYGIFSFAYAATKHVSFKSRFGAGLDYFYDSAQGATENADGEISSDFADVSQLGASLSYTLQVDKLDVFFNMGLYLYDTFKKDGSVYNRMGLRYLFYDHLLINLSMKTHYAVADHVEIGLGWRL